jgi:hypothetical protein
VAADGHRCGSAFQLEVHHEKPFARGGLPTADNLSLRCRAHNGWHADKDFGRMRPRRAESALEERAAGPLAALR